MRIPYGQTECAICVSAFEPTSVLMKLHCGHIFCFEVRYFLPCYLPHEFTQCGSRWLEIGTTCPTCKLDLKSAEEEVSSAPLSPLSVEHHLLDDIDS